MADDTGLRVERRGSALWLTIDRPERGNALTLELVDAATAAIAKVDDRISAVVVTGSGRVFCPGADGRMVSTVLSGGKDSVTSVIYASLHGLVRAIAAAPVPVIAAINGPATGGGCDLALACDLRVAHPDAHLQSSWVSLGLVPGMGGSFAAQRLVGSARAAELLLLGRDIPSHQALEWGLVNEVADDLEGAVAVIVARLEQLPRQGVAANKRALRRIRDVGMEAELHQLGLEQGELITSPVFRTAVDAVTSRSRH